ncbi:MAG: MarR family transcriptional regulator [Roseiarcus sp.]|jgi:DNA-binding MarR family transcriptional regulator
MSSATMASKRTGRARAKPEHVAAPPKVKLGPLDGYIAFHLRMAQEVALRAFIASSHQPDFKRGHFATLMVIGLNPGLSQIEACRAIGRDKSTLSPLIRELARDELILRESSSVDRRSVTLRLSPKGQKVLDTLLKYVEAHERRLDAIVGEAKAELIGLMKRIAATLS